MTSKVIIRIGEKSEKVDKENIFDRGVYRFSKDLSVVFIQSGIYYLIVTDEELINDLYDATAESEETDNYDEANSIVKNMIKQYINDNFDDFNSRVEKAVKTAHGIGIKKMANKSRNTRMYSRPTNTAL
jgi:hypothetical protein